MRWYWIDETPGPRPCRVHARASVIISATGAGTCRIELAAGGPYRLLVDGKERRRGPWRGDAEHLAVDEDRVVLAAGRHELALEVLWFGDRAPMGHCATEPGWWLALRDARGDAVEVTWRARRDPAFAHNDCDGRLWWRAMMGGAGLGELVDLRLVDDHWSTAAVDWPPPRAHATPAPAWRHGMPALAQLPVAEVAYAADDGPLTIPPDHHARALLVDCGRLTTGRPVLALRGGDGRRIEVAYAERLEDPAGRRHFPARPRAGLLAAPRFAPRDSLLAPSGRARWRPMHRRTFRYLELTVQPGATPLVIEDIQAVEERFPADRRARFACSRAVLAEVVETCWRTAALCAHEHLCDGPAYEDAQYAGDILISGEVFTACSGDARLWEQACRQLAWIDDERGLFSTRHPGPAHERQHIPNFEWFWLMSVDRLARWRDATELSRTVLPALRRVVTAHRARLRDGLIRGGEDPCFIDWAWGHCLQGFRHPVDAEGTSLIANLQAVVGLAAAARVSLRAGEPALAGECTRLRDELRAGVERHGWLADEARYADAPGHPGRSEHAQLWAVLAGIAAEPAQLLRRTLAADDVARCSLFHDHHLFTAAKAAGCLDAVVPRLERFVQLVESGSTTFPEEDGAHGWIRSECHAWSSWPALTLIEDLAGLGFTAPDRITIRPRPWADLEHAQASLPWHDTEVVAGWHRDGDRLHLAGHIPDGLQAELRIAGEEPRPISGSWTHDGLWTDMD